MSFTTWLAGCPIASAPSESAIGSVAVQVQVSGAGRSSHQAWRAARKRAGVPRSKPYRTASNHVSARTTPMHDATASRSAGARSAGRAQREAAQKAPCADDDGGGTEAEDAVSDPRTGERPGTLDPPQQIENDPQRDQQGEHAQGRSHARDLAAFARVDIGG